MSSLQGLFRTNASLTHPTPLPPLPALQPYIHYPAPEIQPTQVYLEQLANSTKTISFIATADLTPPPSIHSIVYRERYPEPAKYTDSLFAGWRLPLIIEYDLSRGEHPARCKGVLDEGALIVHTIVKIVRHERHLVYAVAHTPFRSLTIGTTLECHNDLNGDWQIRTIEGLGNGILKLRCECRAFEENNRVIRHRGADVQAGVQRESSPGHGESCSVPVRRVGLNSEKNV
ncbi:hypothetical protein C8J57DRAFT_1217128 [Mycena rebaudengoi]|nr:hypothetical protein C8J57DRAFT_1217128 [Mycena rebaudengoi]